MFEIRERSDGASAELVEAYRSVAPATLGHLIDGSAMDPRIKPVCPGSAAVGPALTIWSPDRDSTACHKAIDLVEPGDVLVIARDGADGYACWGEMMTLAAKLRGAAAVIVDGPITDVQALRELGLPVFARGATALTTQLLGERGGVNVPVVCGGVEVSPGDLILADEDGILVLAPDLAASLLPAAREEETADAEYRRELLAGRLPSELAGIDDLIRRADGGIDDTRRADGNDHEPR